MGEDTTRSRLGRLREQIAANGFEGVIITPGPNLKYYIGITAPLFERLHLLFVPKIGNPHVVAPTFEVGPYSKTQTGAIIHPWNDGEGPTHELQALSHQIDLGRKWGVEGSVPYQFIHLLKKISRPELEDAEPMLQGIREIKERREIRLLHLAASILSKAYLKIPNLIKLGISEIDLANRVTQEIYSCGADRVDEVLVQTGASTADPHHTSQSKKIRRKECVVVDASCSYNGYYADITRTFITGRNSEAERIYQNVLAAQEEAIKATKTNATTGSIDKAARDRLRKAGLDNYFTHRTGHGLGLEVHEAPYIIPNGEEKLREDMFFTVEPGTYIEGKMGIRIEDDVQVTGNGPNVLTKRLPKELGWWKQ